MRQDRELEEFYKDFGEPPLPASELEAILEQARLVSDQQLCLLVKAVRLSRWLLPLLLERIEKRGGISDESEDQVLKLAR
jgi:hypothetical protein